MKLPVDMEILQKYLPESELAKIAAEAAAMRENHKLYMRKKRENHKAGCEIHGEIHKKERENHKEVCENHKEVCENHKEVCENHRKSCENHTGICENHKAENCEICSKMQFLGKNLVNFTPAKGGFGGVVLNTSTNTSTCTEDDVHRTIEEKEKINKKEKSKKEKKGKIAYSPEFEAAWKAYPRKEGTSKLKAWEAWENQEMPDAGWLAACISLESDKEQWQDETKIPHMATWLNQRRWEPYLERDAKVRARMWRLAALSAPPGKTATPPPKAPPEAKKTHFPADAKLPSLDEWKEMSVEKKFELIAEHKCENLGDLYQEILRREEA